jgi:kynurenine formamidase
MEKVSTIKTFEDACEALGLDPTKLPDVSMLPEKNQKAIVAHYKLIVVTDAVNEGWQPNWDDSNEWKYYPWFDVEASEEKPSGSGLSCNVCDSWSTGTSVGSRLCFKSAELAEYAGKQFKPFYEEYFLFK